ncbi:adenosylhomocysteinase, partial [Microbacterium sp. H6]
LRALGVQVGVTETDPVRALRATHDGYRIGRLHDLAPGALVVSATGAPH